MSSGVAAVALGDIGRTRVCVGLLAIVAAPLTLLRLVLGLVLVDFESRPQPHGRGRGKSPYEGSRWTGEED